MKKRVLLLNLSLIFGVAYHALYIVGYLLQKTLLGWEYPPIIREQLETVYSVPVIVIMAVCGIAFAVLVLLMRKNTSRRMFIGAIVFSGGALVTERFVNNIITGNVVSLNKLLAEKGELGEIAYSLNRTAVAMLDMFLLPMFVTAIVLMCCAFCVKEEIHS